MTKDGTLLVILKTRLTDEACWQHTSLVLPWVTNAVLTQILWIRCSSGLEIKQRMQSMRYYREAMLRLSTKMALWSGCLRQIWARTFETRTKYIIEHKNRFLRKFASCLWSATFSASLRNHLKVTFLKISIRL